MPELPKADIREFARLRAERALADEERAAADERAATLQKSLDNLGRMLASMNDRLDLLTSMLRRREEQLERSEQVVRRLKRKLAKLDPDDPDSGASQDASATESEANTDATEESRSSSGDGAVGEAKVPDEGEVEPVEDSTPLTDDESTASQEEPPPDPPAKKPRPRSRGGRRTPPGHLQEEVERHSLCTCGKCGSDAAQRNVLTTRTYTAVASYVRCRTIQREQVVCKVCNALSVAPMPPMPVQRALYDCSFIAWLVMMKFVLLVPLDRVRTLLQSQGIDLAMGSLVHLIERAATLLDPIDGEHLKQLRAGAYFCFDGTGLKTLVLGQPKAWDGYLEVFTRDELTVFQFDMTKHADRLRDRLRDFQGILVADAESRNTAAAPDGVFAFCNAHPLRKFRDAERAQPKLAKQAMRFIEALYELEDIAADQGLFGKDRVAFRQRRSRQVLHRFQQWLQGVHAMDLPPTDPLGKVVRYYLKHFANLTRFVDHAEIPLDNNAAEREFQRHAKLRYACLFAGSVEGAHRWATLLGVVRTAQKCDLDVQAYLTWVFERRGSHKKRFGMAAQELTPMAYRDLLRQQAYAEAAAA